MPEAWVAITMALVQGAVYWQKKFGDAAVFALLPKFRAHVHLARFEILASAVKDVNADYLLWFDDDAVPPADILERLMAHDKDMAVPLFTTRHVPAKWPQSHIVDIKGTDGSRRIITSNLPEIPKELTKIGVAGFHTILMKRKVVNAVLKATEGKSPFTSMHTGTVNVDEIRSMGEDVMFCYYANMAGQELWLDPTLESGHVGAYVYGTKDFEKVTP